MSAHFSSAEDVSAALEQVAYLADEGVATATFLALELDRPLFLEGEPGVGKTSLAIALAQVLGGELVRLQCYEGIDSTQALYDWDFPRQLLHLRAAEASGIADPAATGGLPLRPAVPARPPDPARPGDLHAGAPQRAADRRDRPRRRRVRGVPAGGAQRLRRHHPRARHRARPDAAAGDRHLQPHARRPRRPQASLPLPLAGPPRPGPRGRDPAPSRPRPEPAAGRAGRVRRRRGCAASGWSSRRGSPSRWTGPARCRCSAPGRSRPRPPPPRSAPW